MVPARYGHRAAPSRSSGLGSSSWLCAMPVASAGRLPVADLRCSRLRFLTVKRNDRPMIIRVKMEDIGRGARSILFRIGVQADLPPLNHEARSVARGATPGLY
jgi:hypothetical protein